jgi:diguanylate cyclase (GGDEF) domain
MHLARNPERDNFDKIIKLDHIIDALYFQVILLILVLITNEIYRQIVNKERENEKLLSDLELHYKELNKTNEKLTYSIGEFFTLQQVSQAIGSILDIHELMKFVNDIMLGVMGVKTSTIILSNKETSKLEVHTTNITNDKDYETLCQNINCEALLNALESCTPIFNNNVDSNKYIFTRGRNVKSLICIPICAKTEKFGLILIEQDFKDAFNEDKVRLLTIIAQQVAMALENAVLYQRMHELAMRDGLTGAYNRMHFNQKLEEELKLAQKNNQELTLAMFDIDYFKQFNDTYGHLFGDKVLKSVAKLVDENIRSKDVFARIGGEEFIIILPNTAAEEAFEMIEELRKKISAEVVCDNIICTSVTASFGIANFPKNSRNIKEILKNADDALYDAKRSGRNCVKVAKYL